MCNDIQCPCKHHGCISKIIVFGSTGMLGNYIYKYLSRSIDGTAEVIAIDRSICDAERADERTLSKLFTDRGIGEGSVVINAIGIIPQISGGYTSDEMKSKYTIVNIEFPRMLSNVCKRFGSELIHASTDCVFSGERGGYRENDYPDSYTDYGLSKSLGDNCVLYDATIIRTSIIGENKRGISLLEWLRSSSNSSVNGYDNHRWNGITCLQYAKIIKRIIDSKMFWKGVRHIFSPDIVSKFELLTMINDIYKMGVTINKVSPEPPIDKSLVSIYNTNALFDIPSLRDQITELRDFAID